MKHTMYIFLILSLMASLLFLSSCQPSDDPFDPPVSGTSEVPSDWMPQKAYNANYINIKEVSPEKMPAKHIELPGSQQEQFLMPLSDGGCLALSEVLINENDKNSSNEYNLRAIRFRADGSVYWDRTYQDLIFSGIIYSMCILPDDGFAVSLRSLKIDPETSDPIQRLYRFSPDGSLLWKSKDEEIPAGSLEYIFAAKDRAVLTAGSAVRKSLNGSYAAGSRIVLLRFETDGRLSKFLTIDRTGEDHLKDASYAAKTGLLILWRDNVECLNEDLDSEWAVKIRSAKSLYKIQALSDEEGAIASGTLSGGSAFVFIDNRGAEKLIYSDEDENAYISSLARLRDRRIAAVKSVLYDEKKQTSELIVSSGTGTDKIIIDRFPGVIYKLIQTKDGGLTVMARQNVSYIPQTGSVSYTWTDTEAIIAHYGSDMHLIWRRKIDQYKDVSRGDIIVPTVDGRLLIG